MRQRAENDNTQHEINACLYNSTEYLFIVFSFYKLKSIKQIRQRMQLRPCGGGGGLITEPSRAPFGLIQAPPRQLSFFMLAWPALIVT